MIEYLSKEKDSTICDLPKEVSLFAVKFNKSTSVRYLNLGLSPLGEFLTKYMGAQFYSDIIFMRINGKFVWMDISP